MEYFCLILMKYTYGLQLADYLQYYCRILIFLKVQVQHRRHTVGIELKTRFLMVFLIINVVTYPRCKDVEVTHVCDKGTWIRKVDGVITPHYSKTPVADGEWKDPACNACEEKPLSIWPEVGLNLVCMIPGESVLTADNKYEVSAQRGRKNGYIHKVHTYI